MSVKSQVLKICFQGKYVFLSFSLEVLSVLSSLFPILLDVSIVPLSRLVSQSTLLPYDLHDQWQGPNARDNVQPVTGFSCRERTRERALDARQWYAQHSPFSLLVSSLSVSAETPVFPETTWRLTTWLTASSYQTL